MKVEENKSGLVSVIIPAFNRIDYIGETIESVLSQTYSNIELIVVDDGSSDGTYELLQSLAGEGKLRLFSHPKRENKGQSAALNIGLKNSLGEFIAILDSDDLFEPDKIQSQVDYLNSHPSVGIVYGNGTGVDGNGKFLYDIEGKFAHDPSDPNEVLLDCYFLLPQNSLVRTNVYNLVGGFNESYRAAQDHDMLIRLAEKTDIAFIPEKLFKYRRHGDSISQNGQITRWTNGFKILKSATERYSYKKSTIRKRKAVLHFRLGLAQFKCHGVNKLKAAANMLWALFYDPVRAIKVVLRIDRSSFSS